MTVRRGPLVLLVLVGAGAVLASSALTWVVADLSGQLAGAGELPVSGTRAAPVVPALALVALAGGAALAAARRRGVLPVGLLLVVAGAGVVAGALGAVTDPSSAAGPAAGEATGLAGAELPATATPWPWGAAVGGLVVLAAGVLAVLSRRSWAGARRLDAPAAGAAAAPPDRDPVGGWDALSAGEDPTDDAPAPPHRDTTG